MTAPTTSVYGVHLDSQGRVLLIHDAHSQLWGFPGGRMEDGETHRDALCRELLEETGMTPGGEITFITTQNDDKKHRYFYAVESLTGKLGSAGNDTDIAQVAYFETTSLPAQSLAPGVASVPADNLR